MLCTKAREYRSSNQTKWHTYIQPSASHDPTQDHIKKSPTVLLATLFSFAFPFPFAALRLNSVEPEAEPNTTARMSVGDWIALILYVLLALCFAIADTGGLPRDPPTVGHFLGLLAAPYVLVLAFALVYRWSTGRRLARFGRTVLWTGVIVFLISLPSACVRADKGREEMRHFGQTASERGDSLNQSYSAKLGTVELDLKPTALISAEGIQSARLQLKEYATILGQSQVQVNELYRTLLADARKLDMPPLMRDDFIVGLDSSFSERQQSQTELFRAEAETISAISGLLDFMEHHRSDVQLGKEGGLVFGTSDDANAYNALIAEVKRRTDREEILRKSLAQGAAAQRERFRKEFSR